MIYQVYLESKEGGGSDEVDLFNNIIGIVSWGGNGDY